jgi:hypothetical protein
MLLTFVVSGVGLSRSVMETTTTTAASTVKGSSSSPSFLDDFTLHLASHLLGHERLMFEFDQAMKKNKQKTKTRNSTSATTGIHSDNEDSMPSSLTISLYWRSNMLLKDTASVLQSLSLTEKKDAEDRIVQPPLLFVDITFSFDGATDASNQQQLQEEMKPPTPRPSMSMVVGVFFLTHHKGTYIQGSPLTIFQLEQHAKSVGLDLHSAPPTAMAGMMAEALMQQTTNPPQVLLSSLQPESNRNNKDPERHDEPMPESPTLQHQQSAQLELYYKDVEGTGTLQLSDSKRSSGFDSIGLSLFCRDLFGPSSSGPHGTSCRSDTHHEPFASDPTSALQEAFDKWWKQASILDTTRVEGTAAHDRLNSTAKESTTTTDRGTAGGRGILGSSSSRATKAVGLSGYSKLSHLHKRRKKDKNMNPFSTLPK